MPLPLLIVGVAVAAAGWGVKKGVDAASDFSDAKDTDEQAHDIIDEAQKSLKKSQQRNNRKLEQLGKTKVEICTESLSNFVGEFKKLKNVDFHRFQGSEDLPEFTGKDLVAIEETSISLTEVASGGTAALTSGALTGIAAYGSVGILGTASTGTAIAGLSGAAATNATLAWLGGGSLAAGGMGMAGGAAVLGGIVAAPVLLVGGFVIASKAEKALDDARSNLATAKVQREKMKNAETAANAIGNRANQTRTVLLKLEPFLGREVELLSNVVKENNDFSTYSGAEEAVVLRAASLAKTMKNVIDCQVIDENGKVTKAIRQSLRTANDVLKQIEAV